MASNTQTYRWPFHSRMPERRSPTNKDRRAPKALQVSSHDFARAAGRSRRRVGRTRSCRSLGRLGDIRWILSWPPQAGRCGMADFVFLLRFGVPVWLGKNDLTFGADNFLPTDPHRFDAHY